MAFAYYSSTFGDFSAPYGGTARFDDDNETVIGAGEGTDDTPCNCGCPASQTFSWASSLIEGLSEPDQRKAVNMIVNHYKHYLGGAKAKVSGAAEPLFAEPLFIGAAERSVAVDVGGAVDSADATIDEDIDFSYGDSGTQPTATDAPHKASSSGFHKVSINEISDARDEFISENNDYEQIDINFNPIEEPVSFEADEDMTKELFEIFNASS